MNEEKLNELLGTMVNELGAAAVGASVIIGDKLGLFRALAANDGLTSEQLAAQTGTAERYVREWLAGQAASGYITYDGEAGTFHMTAEQAAVLADEDSPVYLAGGFYGLESIYASEPTLTEAFREVAWAGASTATACSAVRRSSSVLAIELTLLLSGCLRSTAL